MKKTFKKIAACLMATASLGTCLIGMSASATNWGLYNNPSGPSESRKYYDAAGFYTSSKLTKLYERCTSYSSNQNGVGITASVSYKPYAIDSAGNRINICSNTRYHQQYDTSQKTISLDTAAPAYSTVYGNYTLKDYSEIYCAIYGYISNTSQS